MNKTAIVTGGTSGIGKAAALALKNDGWTVYELSRRLTGTEGINHITADITDESGVAAAVEQVVSAEGHIDLVVNNAGFGISGAVEFTDTEDAKRLFDTDFFGMVRINRLIIPIMRKQGGGKIINISSVAAPIPIPFQTYYSAAKAAALTTPGRGRLRISVSSRARYTSTAPAAPPATASMRRQGLSARSRG